MTSSAIAAPTRAAPRTLSSVTPDTWVIFAIAAVATLQFAQIFVRSINWDEFGHYNHIVQLHAGQLGQVLQRFHAFAYSWVTALPGGPIDHIIVIRLFMFACEMVVLLAIVGIANRFVERVPAILCGLAYISFSYVFQHGASFRYDPPLAAVLMGLIWLLLRTKLDWKTIIGAGLLVALLPLISMKAVIYFPAVAGVVWLRWAEHGFSPRFVARMVFLASTAGVWFAGLFLLFTQWTAALSGMHDTLSAEQAAGAVFALFDNPNTSRLVRAGLTNPLTTLVVIAFPVVLARIEHTVPEKIALIGLFSILLSPLIYINTAPYYFVFMLAPVLAACGPVFAAAMARLPTPAVALLLCASTAMIVFTEQPSVLERQRNLHAAAISTFGEDVRYFDFPGFLGTPGKSNAFLSPLVVSIHNREGELMLRPAMEEHAVPLLLANNFILENALDTSAVQQLQPEDSAALRDNYVTFWGPLWIAGRDIPAESDMVYRNLVPGTFTVRENPVEIDGQLIAAGETVQLDRKTYRLTAPDGAARLLWGEHLVPPTAPPPEPPYWELF